LIDDPWHPKKILWLQTGLLGTQSFSYECTSTKINRSIDLFYGAVAFLLFLLLTGIQSYFEAASANFKKQEGLPKNQFTIILTPGNSAEIVQPSPVLAPVNETSLQQSQNTVHSDSITNTRKQISHQEVEKTISPNTPAISTELNSESIAQPSNQTQKSNNALPLVEQISDIVKSTVVDKSDSLEDSVFDSHLREKLSSSQTRKLNTTRRLEEDISFTDVYGNGMVKTPTGCTKVIRDNNIGEMWIPIKCPKAGQKLKLFDKLKPTDRETPKAKY
jgi:hypothetical protein